MILDIGSMRSRAKMLLKSKPIYSTLLEAITMQDFYYDDNVDMPTMKSLAQMSQLSYSAAVRHLKLMYNDLCSNEGELSIPFNFDKIDITFGIEGFLSRASMSVSKLSIIPRIGERVRVPFFRELTGTDYFYVKDIYHELLDDKQYIYISLKYGSPNRYWELRKDQAITLGEFSIMDDFRKSERELQEELNVRPGRAW